MQLSRLSILIENYNYNEIVMKEKENIQELLYQVQKAGLMLSGRVLSQSNTTVK